MKNKVTIHDDIDSTTWDLPFVDGPNLEAERQKTNAINRTSEWKYEPPEVEEEILPPTAEEIEAIRQAAYQEGYEQGKQQGYDEGKAEGHAEGLAAGQEEGFAAGNAQGLEAGTEQINALATQWQGLIDTFHAPLEQVNENTRQQLVKLATVMAKAVIRTEVQTSDAAILQALSEGLKLLPINEASYQISLHPEDIELIKAHFGEDVEAQKGWVFLSSPGMERGGCDVSTTHNAVDVSIERRTRGVITQFLLEQGLVDE